MSPAHNPRNSLEFLLGSLVTQGEAVDKKLTQLRLDIQDGLSGLTSRVSSLEHDRTMRKATIAFVSAAVGFVASMAANFLSFFQPR